MHGHAGPAGTKWGKFIVDNFFVTGRLLVLLGAARLLQKLGGMLFPDQEENRKVYCVNYEACLSEAARANLRQMRCRGCREYQPEKKDWIEIESIAALLKAIFEIGST